MNTYRTQVTQIVQLVIATAVSLFGATSTVQAEEYCLHFSDPVGDSTPYIDVTGMDFRFDPITGAYSATVFANSGQFFSGSVWLNLVLLNTDRVAAGSGMELLTVGTITGQWAPAMELSLSGTSDILTTWRAGDSVAPGQFVAPPINGPLPPEGGAGNTSVRTFAVNGISFHYLDDMGIDQSAVVQVVPEPSKLALGAICLLLIVGTRKLSKLIEGPCKRFPVMALSLAALFTATTTTRAEEFTLHFSDPVGDASTVLDFTGMDFSFNPATGDYRARISASDAIPFPASGNLVHIYLNLLNLDRQETGAGFELLSITQDPPTVQYTPDYIDLSGVSSVLTSWQAGDRIAPGQSAATIGGLIPPPQTSRNTALIYGDSIGLPWHIDDMGIDQVAIVQVPEPSTLLLAGLGAVAFGIVRQARSRRRITFE